jgi:hypothetical protein
MKNAVFWDVAPCGYCVNRRFGGMYRLHLQPPAHVGSSLADFFFYSEDGGDVFLQNVGLHNIYTASHCRRWHSYLKYCFHRLFNPSSRYPEYILTRL